MAHPAIAFRHNAKLGDLKYKVEGPEAALAAIQRSQPPKQEETPLPKPTRIPEVKRAADGPKTPPNYRPAPGAVSKCGSCQYFEQATAHCKKFHTRVDANYTCDDWEGKKMSFPGAENPSTTPGTEHFGDVGDIGKIAAAKAIEEITKEAWPLLDHTAGGVGPAKPLGPAKPNAAAGITPPPPQPLLPQPAATTLPSAQPAKLASVKVSQGPPMAPAMPPPAAPMAPAGLATSAPSAPSAAPAAAPGPGSAPASPSSSAVSPKTGQFKPSPLFSLNAQIPQSPSLSWLKAVREPFMAKSASNKGLYLLLEKKAGPPLEEPLTQRLQGPPVAYNQLQRPYGGQQSGYDQGQSSSSRYLQQLSNRAVQGDPAAMLEYRRALGNMNELNRANAAAFDQQGGMAGRSGYKPDADAAFQTQQAELKQRYAETGDRSLLGQLQQLARRRAALNAMDETTGAGGPGFGGGQIAGGQANVAPTSPEFAEQEKVFQEHKNNYEAAQTRLKQLQAERQADITHNEDQQNNWQYGKNPFSRGASNFANFFGNDNDAYKSDMAARRLGSWMPSGARGSQLAQAEAELKQHQTNMEAARKTMTATQKQLAVPWYEREPAAPAAAPAPTAPAAPAQPAAPSAPPIPQVGNPAGTSGVPHASLGKPPTSLAPTMKLAFSLDALAEAAARKMHKAADTFTINDSGPSGCDAGTTQTPAAAAPPPVTPATPTTTAAPIVPAAPKVAAANFVPAIMAMQEREKAKKMLKAKPQRKPAPDEDLGRLDSLVDELQPQRNASKEAALMALA